MKEEQEQLAGLQAERAAFEMLLPALLKTHAGQFAAIHNNQVVDTDADEGELAWRVIGRGLKPVYIGEVRSEPRIYDVPSLEVIPHVSLQPEMIRETLAGYAAANEIIENERIERLARMTPEEAHAIYDDLVNGWRPPASAEERQRLDLWRAETLIAVRRAFDQLAQAQGAV